MDYPVVQARPVAPDQLPLWARCEEALEQAAASRYIPTPTLLALRAALSAVLIAHVVLFTISGDYRLNQLQGLSALFLALSSVLLLLASLLSLLSSFRGRSAFISIFLLSVPLLQGSLTVSLFAAVIRLSLNAPKHAMPWKYSLIAAIVLDPLCGILLVLTSQNLEFHPVHSIAPLVALFAFHSIAAMKWKTAGHIVAQHLDYRSTTEKHQIIAHLAIVIVAICSAAITLAFAHAYRAFACCTLASEWKKKYRGQRLQNSSNNINQSSDPDVDDDENVEGDVENNMNNKKKKKKNEKNDRRMRALGGAQRPDRGARTLRISNGSTRSNLPWFSRSDFTLEEPDDWVHVESEYGSRTLDEDAVTRIDTN